MNPWRRANNAGRPLPNEVRQVGLILCEDKKDAVVRYTLSQGNKQIFASRYKLYLPTEQELIEEMRRERLFLEAEKRRRLK